MQTGHRGELREAKAGALVCDSSIQWSASLTSTVAEYS